MQIKITGNQIHLARYSGSSNTGDSRRSLTARIGSFSANVLPEFCVSDSSDHERSIPYRIYRSTTPDEHEQIIKYVRDLRLSELSQRVQCATAELREIEHLVADELLDSVGAKSLHDACAAMSKKLRKIKTRTDAKIENAGAQVPDLAEEAMKS